MNGIDISMYQKNVDFNKVKSSGVTFVYIKATEGVDYIDPVYREHLEKIKNTGLNYGMYHFMSERTDPKKQAQDFYSSIKGTGFNLIPVLDIESNTMGRSKAAVTLRCIEFLEEFKRLSGIDCIVYTYTSFANSYIDNRLSKYKCWIANYNGGATVSANSVWNSYVGHQYSDKGSINGISGNVDINNFTDSILLNKQATTSVNSNKSTTNTSKVSTHLRDFQKAYNDTYRKNILVDGIFGSQTEEALKNTIVKKGQNNSLVAWLQCRIGADIDGKFGANTDSKLREFQKNNGLSVDGIAGYNTFKKLLEKFNW